MCLSYSEDSGNRCAAPCVQVVVVAMRCQDVMSTWRRRRETLHLLVCALPGDDCTSPEQLPVPLMQSSVLPTNVLSTHRAATYMVVQFGGGVRGAPLQLASCIILFSLWTPHCNRTLNRTLMLGRRLNPRQRVGPAPRGPQLKTFKPQTDATRRCGTDK